jgi:hypothetical protein
MNVSQDHDCLKLRDLPSNLWVVGASFIFLATIFICKGMGVLFAFETAPLWVGGLELSLGLFGLVAGIFAFLHNPMIAAEFTPLCNRVAVRKQGLLFATPLEMPLQQIAEIEVGEFKGIQGDPAYCLQLKTVSGEKIQLSAGWTPGKAPHDEAAAQIRDFLGTYGMRV